MTLVATTSRPPLVAQADGYKVFAVSWPVVGPIRGEGLLLVPNGAEPVADVIAIPDADQTPEMICGLEAGVAEGIAVCPDAGRARLSSARAGSDRSQTGTAKRASDNDDREYLYRSAFELGRHLIGYEVQKVLAGGGLAGTESTRPKIPALSSWGGVREACWPSTAQPSIRESM